MDQLKTPEYPECDSDEAATQKRQEEVVASPVGHPFGKTDERRDVSRHLAFVNGLRQARANRTALHQNYAFIVIIIVQSRKSFKNDAIENTVVNR